MANICIIPARGGSKRIPRKNIKEFFGKTIIAYSIEAALNSRLFEEIMVSTDDDEIANIAKQFGASIPFKRSTAAASDDATTADVILEVIDQYESRGRMFENFCCIYPCAPFITPENLKDSYRQMRERKLDSIFPVVAFSFPIQRALRVVDGTLSFYYPEYGQTRSQDLEKAFHDAGQYYWVNTLAFKTEKKIVMDNCGAVIISDLEAQDIDNETDWKIAEIKYRLLRNGFS